MSPISMSVPVAGALTLRESLAGIDLIVLLLIGLCAHIFGFGLNDLIDFALDQTVPNRKKFSPLLSGRLSKQESSFFVLAQIPTAFILYAFALNPSITGAIILSLSIVLSLVYNLWSKWGSIPHIFPELALASSVGLLSLFGAEAIHNYFSVTTITFSAGVTVTLLLLNSVPSGLKDLKTDLEYGARSFVIDAGCRVSEDALVIPYGLQVFCRTINIILIVLILILLFLNGLSIFSYIVVICLLLLGYLHLNMVLHSPNLQTLNSSRVLLSGYYNYTALSLTLFTWMPNWLKVLYIMLTIWVFSIPLFIAIGVSKGRYRIV